MARKKRITKDDVENYQEHLDKDKIANTATSNERVSWNRKSSNMQKLIDDLRPVEEQISDLLVEKNKLVDKISELRTLMVHQCIHPYEYLVAKHDHYECKFCNRRFVIVDQIQTLENA